MRVSEAQWRYITDKKRLEFFCSMPIPIKLCGLTIFLIMKIYSKYTIKTNSHGSAYLPKSMTIMPTIPALYMSELRNCLYS